MPSQILTRSRIATDTRIGSFSGNWGSFFPGAFCVFQADAGFDPVANTWQDQSGRNLIATPQNAGTNPTQVAGLNGHGGLGFPTVTTGMKWTMALPLPSAAPYYLFMVVKQNTWVSGHTFFVAGSANVAFFQTPGNVSPVVDQAITAHANPSSGLTIGSFGVLEAGFTGTTADYVRAGNGARTSGQSAGNSASASSTPASLGANGSGVGALMDVLLFVAAPGRSPPANARNIAREFYGPALLI